MQHGQIRGESKQRKLNENRGTFINFAEIVGNFINFVEIGGNSICIIGLMDAPGYKL